MTDPAVTVGIIAGAGELPVHIARSLHGSGKTVFVAALKGAAGPGVEDPSWKTEWVDFHRLGDLLASLEGARVSEVVLAGNVAHREIFRVERFDERMLSFLRGLEDHSGSSLLSAFAGLLTREGYRIPSLLEVVPDLAPARGHLAGPPPDQGAVPDISLGWAMARRLADLEIGQSVVVKGGAVVAVEGMEGTDGAVKRALDLAGEGVTVVKRAAGDHDFRFDVPTIGKRTIEVLSGGKGQTVVVEAGRCFILDREEVVSLCGGSGVTLLACREGEDGAVSWA